MEADWVWKSLVIVVWLMIPVGMTYVAVVRRTGRARAWWLIGAGVYVAAFFILPAVIVSTSTGGPVGPPEFRIG